MNVFQITLSTGFPCYMTAEQISLQVSEDSNRSNYNWFASATELARVCDCPDFPEECAQQIKSRILHCFAHIELVFHGFTEQETVYSCYNSLFGSGETGQKARETYLMAFISHTLVFYWRHFFFWGPAYCSFCNQWKENKFQQYVLAKELDFKQLRIDLERDLEDAMVIKARNGAFKTRGTKTS